MQFSEIQYLRGLMNLEEGLQEDGVEIKPTQELVEEVDLNVYAYEAIKVEAEGEAEFAIYNRLFDLWDEYVKWPKYEVTVIREAGKDILGDEYRPYGEEKITLRAETPKKAVSAAQLLTVLTFRGQEMRTLLNGEEYLGDY